MALEVKLLHRNARKPTKGNPEDVGWDLYLPKTMTLEAHGRNGPDTGIGVAILTPPGWGALIRPRSSATSRGIHVAGTIDRYTGELHLVLWNLTNKEIACPAGSRVAQFIPFWSGAGGQQHIVDAFMDMDVEQSVGMNLGTVLLKNLTACDGIRVVEEFTNPPKRGDGGFGSTGA